VSGEATGYVYRSSSARGATFTVHLAIADTANDAHDYRFWLPVGAIAAKARVSRSTAVLAIAWLVEHGYLERLSPGGNPGRAEAVEYRFLLEGLVLPSDKPASPTTGQAPVRWSDKSCPTIGQARTTALRKGTEEEPNANEFESFWKACPRRIDKGHARKAFTAARRKGVDLQTILAGISAYAESVKGSEARFIAHPATWLRGERWTDEVPPDTTDALIAATWGPNA
jgi:hypothetical protein